MNTGTPNKPGGVLHRATHLPFALAHTMLNPSSLIFYIHPSYFGPRMWRSSTSSLESKLYSDVEGICSGQFGFIIAVVSISDIGNGMVILSNDQAEVITRYRAI